MANDELKLKIITPERIFFDGMVNRAIFKSTEGELAILNDHVPITVLIDSSSFKIIQGDEEKMIAVHGGFVEARDGRMTVLTDAAEWPYELDEERAKESERRARERLNKEVQAEEIDLLRAEIALKRALTRMEVIQYNK